MLKGIVVVFILYFLLISSNFVCSDEVIKREANSPLFCLSTNSFNCISLSFLLSIRALKLAKAISFDESK